ncbi:MAG: fumarate hydratase [Candidatus Firestonebacteria bacterium]
MTFTEKQISDIVKNLCLKANFNLRKDVQHSLQKAYLNESNSKAKYILGILIENYKIAEKENIPICQDTGLVVVFVEIGHNAQIKCNLTDAINKGIKLSYKDGYLRKSIVSDPIIRKNTKTNTPAVIHYNLVKGNKLKIQVLLKGFGSENKSKIFMLNPTATNEDIIHSVISSIKSAGPDACPPYVVGIGIGGDLSKAVYLSKKALLYPIGFWSDKVHLKNIAKKIFQLGHKLNIGPSGVGGKTTLLGVNILSYPTHIAGMPLAVNISCHALRSAEITL